MNKVILMGRLTRDPEIRYGQGENAKAFARFTLAVDRKFKKDGEDNADFISCVAFGKTAEVMEKHTRQGTKLVIEGRIQTGSYTNKDGQRGYTTDVMVESLEFAESRKAAEDNQQSARPNPQNAQNESFMSIPDSVEDEGLPFA